MAVAEACKAIFLSIPGLREREGERKKRGKREGGREREKEREGEREI